MLPSLGRYTVRSIALRSCLASGTVAEPPGDETAVHTRQSEGLGISEAEDLEAAMKRTHQQVRCSGPLCLSCSRRKSKVWGQRDSRGHTATGSPPVCQRATTEAPKAIRSSGKQRLRRAWRPDTSRSSGEPALTPRQARLLRPRWRRGRTSPPSGKATAGDKTAAQRP